MLGDEILFSSEYYSDSCLLTCKPDNMLNWELPIIDASDFLQNCYWGASDCLNMQPNWRSADIWHPRDANWTPSNKVQQVRYEHEGILSKLAMLQFLLYGSVQSMH